MKANDVAPVLLNEDGEDAKWNLTKPAVQEVLAVKDSDFGPGMTADQAISEMEKRFNNYARKKSN